MSALVSLVGNNKKKYLYFRYFTISVFMMGRLLVRFGSSCHRGQGWEMRLEKHISRYCGYPLSQILVVILPDRDGSCTVQISQTSLIMQTDTVMSSEILGPGSPLSSSSLVEDWM